MAIHSVKIGFVLAILPSAGDLGSYRFSCDGCLYPQTIWGGIRATRILSERSVNGVAIL